MTARGGRSNPHVQPYKPQNHAANRVGRQGWTVQPSHLEISDFWRNMTHVITPFIQPRGEALEKTKIMLYRFLKRNRHGLPLSAIRDELAEWLAPYVEVAAAELQDIGIIHATTEQCDCHPGTWYRLAPGVSGHMRRE